MTAQVVRPVVIGVDPGPIPGLAVVRPDGTVESLQVTAGVLPVVLRALILDAPTVPIGHPETSATHVRAVVLAGERYVVGNRSTRAKSAGANAATRAMAGAIEALGHDLGVPVRMRAAVEVKTWATAGSPKSRVELAGLTPKGMVHARSAGWHALYTAVHDAGFPDPLSRRGSTTSSPR